MPRIAGVDVKKNAHGEITHVTFSVKKHKEAIAPLLRELGVIQKTQFEIDCENAVTLEEARDFLHKKVEEQWAK